MGLLGLEDGHRYRPHHRTMSKNTNSTPQPLNLNTLHQLVAALRTVAGWVAPPKSRKPRRS